MTAMRMLRSIAAIAAGLGFMAATARVGTLVASALGAGTHPPAGGPSVYLAVTLVVCGVGAIVGGWLAARIATCAPYGHASVMAAILAVLSVSAATGAPATGYPGWYPSILGLIAVLGVLLGGKLRAAAASSTGPVVA